MTQFEDLIKPLDTYEPKPNGRYLPCSATAYHDVNFKPLGKGYCQWCGSQLTGRNKYFCPPVNIGNEQWPRMVRSCAGHWFGYWYSKPRFKRVVYLRDDFTCQMCGLKPVGRNQYGVELPDFDQLCIDHIHPFAKGGKTELHNLQVLCRGCNAMKGDKVGYNQPPLKC